MDISEHFTTSDLLLETRECRVCGKTKNLLDEFYKSRKNPALASSYSYECKVCTLKRVNNYNKTVKKKKYTKGECIICKEYSAKIVDDKCKKCNTALESINYDRQIVKSMLQYLESHYE
jgi:hypothetical protein